MTMNEDREPKKSKEEILSWIKEQARERKKHFDDSEIVKSFSKEGLEKMKELYNYFNSHIVDFDCKELSDMFRANFEEKTAESTQDGSSLNTDE